MSDKQQKPSVPEADNPLQGTTEDLNINLPTGDDTSLEAQLLAAQQQAEKHLESLMYVKAEADNIRKRAAEDIEKARKFALERFSLELLAVKDSLEAALAIDTDAVEGYRNGIDLTDKQLNSVFEKFNIQVINPVNEKFNPHQHQAISMVEHDAEPNTVVNVLQKGYLLFDRVLRPALVMVAKPKGE